MVRIILWKRKKMGVSHQHLCMLRLDAGFYWTKDISIFFLDETGLKYWKQPMNLYGPHEDSYFPA